MRNHSELYWQVFWRQLFRQLKGFFRDENEEIFPLFSSLISVMMLLAAVFCCLTGRLWLGMTGLIIVGLPLLGNLVVGLRNGCQRADWMAQEAVRQAVKLEQTKQQLGIRKTVQSAPVGRRPAQKKKGFPFRPSF